MQNNVALFGGAFDPFHNGHQYIINQLKLLNFKKIILVPTGVSAFNKNLTEARHRINMINAATKDGILFPSLDPSIFEIKFPDNDIVGKARTF